MKNKDGTEQKGFFIPIEVDMVFEKRRHILGQCKSEEEKDRAMEEPSWPSYTQAYEDADKRVKNEN